MHVVLLWSVINEVWFKWVDVAPEKGQTSFFCSMTCFLDFYQEVTSKRNGDVEEL